MKASIKERELREVMHRTVSCNMSPTLRAKLLKVNRKDCVMQVEPTEYEPSLIGSEFVGKTFRMPIDHTWNAYFY
jgi:hypothetical protein